MKIGGVKVRAEYLEPGDIIMPDGAVVKSKRLVNNGESVEISFENKRPTTVRKGTEFLCA